MAALSADPELDVFFSLELDEDESFVDELDESDDSDFDESDELDELEPDVAGLRESVT